MLFTDAIKCGLELGKSITDKDIILIPTHRKTMYAYKYNKGKIGEILFYMGFWKSMTDSRNVNWEIMED